MKNPFIEKDTLTEEEKQNQLTNLLLDGIAKERFVKGLAQSIGNRVYLKDIQTLLNKVKDITPQEKEALVFLIRDIKNLQK